MRHGWLKCSCCLKKLCSPSRLVCHVIKEHGSCTLQCPHCLHRESNQLGLLLHQQSQHPDKPRGFISCKGFQKQTSETSEENFAVREDHLLKCREHSCAYETRCSIEMANHLFVDHSDKAKNYTDFSCVFCQAVFTTASRLVSFQTFRLINLLHPTKFAHVVYFDQCLVTHPKSWSKSSFSCF